jgi:phage terminase large subunit-like protein
MGTQSHRAGALPAPPIDPIRSKADKLALDAGFYYDHAEAVRVWDFFAKFLRHSVGQFKGQPFQLLPWQWTDVIAPLFGWKRADGTRRFREAYIEIPKKNGKSTLCAGLGLYLLMADREPAAEVYCAAADRNQANIVFREALRMVEGSAGLKTKLWPVPSQKQLLYPGTSSFWQALSSEAHTKEGFNIHGLIFDEFHAQPNPDLYDTLKYGGAMRRQPLFIYITTAGYDRESVCWEKHCYAERVLSGEAHDPEFFAYIRAAAVEDDWKCPATWEKANPSYGTTVRPDHFERMAKVAMTSPLEENTFKRYHLNIWTEQAVRWLPIEEWDGCVDGAAGSRRPHLLRRAGPREHPGPDRLRALLPRDQLRAPSLLDPAVRVA